jgi:hypothetical protein
VGGNVNDPDAARRRAIVNPGGKSAQALERSAGLAAPLDPSRHYRVEPGYGEAGPEYFPYTLAGVKAATARARWLPGEQRVIRSRPDVPDLVIRRYRNGREFILITTGD